MPSDNGPLLRTLAPALRELERRLRARLSAKRRDPRSGKGRVGEKGRSRWAPGNLKKKKRPSGFARLRTRTKPTNHSRFKHSRPRRIANRKPARGYRYLTPFRVFPRILRRPRASTSQL